MSYLLIENFKGGLDSRRGRLTSKAGTLYQCENAHLSRGGEIEKRRAFVSFAALPAGQTFGLWSADGNLYTFGSAYSPVVPPAINYQQLIHPTGANMTALLSADNFDGAIYAIAQFDDGSIYHYYGGVRVTSWDALVSSTVQPIGSNDDVSSYLADLINADANFTATASGLVVTISEKTVGIPFNVTPSVTPGGAGSPTLDTALVQASGVDTTEVLATSGQWTLFGQSVGEYNSITINGVEVLGTTVNTSGITDINQANAKVANQINAFQSTYLAVQGSNGYITIQGKTGSGSTSNGYQLRFSARTNTSTTWGPPTIVGPMGSVSSGNIFATMSGGITGQTAAVQVSSVTVGGTIDFDNVYTVTLDIPSTSYSASFTVTRKYNSSSNAAVSQAISRKINNDQFLTSSYIGSTVRVTGRLENVPFVITPSFINGAHGAAVITTQVIQEANLVLPQISEINIGGAYDTDNVYKVNIAIDSQSYSVDYDVRGQATGMATLIKTFGSKMYAEAGSILWFCEIDDPTMWDLIQTNGSGFINMSNQDAGSEVLSGIGIYQGRLAIFARRTTQIWSMDADPTKNAKTQTLTNIGTYAPNSIINYGDVNLFYLSDIGIRSLIPRDASGNATISDVGTNIDSIVQANVATLTPTIAANACAILEPNDGRYWLCVGPENYVYSYFPLASILAWSTYLPGFTIESIVYCNGIIYCRSGDTIYAFGGRNGDIYDDCVVTIEFPYLDGGKPGNVKTLRAIDMECQGTWDVYVGSDPSTPDTKEFVATVTGETYSSLTIPVEQVGTHIGIRLICKTTGYARIGNFAIHFDDNGDL